MQHRGTGEAKVDLEVSPPFLVENHEIMEICERGQVNNNLDI